MTNRELVDRISFFRTNKNLSARELSFSIGKSGNYINHLESAAFNIPSGVLFDILDVLEIPVEDFFSVGSDYTKEGLEMLKLFNKLSEANRITIVDLIKKLQ